MRYLAYQVIMAAILALPCFGETIRVEVEAAANIVQGDTTLARSEAFRALPVRAVEKGLSHFLSEQGIAGKKSLIEKSILPRSGSYITGLEVTSGGIDARDPAIYRLAGTITLQKERLENDLAAFGILTYGKDLPHILVFVQEKNIDYVHWHFQAKTLNYAENAIWNALSTQGFKFVDQTSLAKNIEPETERAIYAEDMSVITALGKKYDAAIVIVGKAISRGGADIGQDARAARAQAVVTLKAIDVKKGEVVAQGSSENEESDGDMMQAGKIAIEAAARVAAIQMIDDITRSQEKPAEVIYNITVFINGVKSIEDLVAFKNELSQTVAGIRSIQQRTYSGSSAAYDLKSTSPVATIVQALQNKGLKSFEVQVRSQSENSLELNLKPIE